MSFRRVVGRSSLLPLLGRRSVIPSATAETVRWHCTNRGLVASTMPLLQSAPSKPASNITGVDLTKKMPSTAKEFDALIPKIRNIGIVAHIDAGKTTATERMLFYAGQVRRIGDVDSGTTTTDYLEEEMQRGITITAAAVTFPWKDYHINLIDTPGHVDFTLEVERSLRVLDGVVALFDASAGVQAQSYTVLRQARKFHTPLIAFINKMDKPNANFQMSVNSVRDKLGVEPLVIMLPLARNNGEFEGVIDVIRGKAMRFSGKQGADVSLTDLTGETINFQEAYAAARHDLLGALSARDDTLAEHLIMKLDECDGDEAAAEAAMTVDDIVAAVRRQTIQSATQQVPLVPVMCGAARRDQGIQPLLDLVLDLLPSPIDRPSLPALNRSGGEVQLAKPCTSDPSSDFLALAFKVIHLPDPKTKAMRPLVFFRCYCGRILKGQEVQLQGKSKAEKVEQLYIMKADDPQPVPFIAAGQIGAAFLNEAATGDSLFREGTAALSLKHKDEKLYKQYKVNAPFSLEGIDVPPPVVSFALEPKSASQAAMTEQALNALQKEDPSFHWLKNDHGQLVVSGMGELHLEIITSRLSREQSLDCQLTKAIIEYRESIAGPAKITNYTLEAHGLPMFDVDLSVEPLRCEDATDEIPKNDNLTFTLPSATKDKILGQLVSAKKFEAASDGASQGESKMNKKAKEDLNEIEKAFDSALQRVGLMGPLARLRLVGGAVRIDGLKLRSSVDHKALPMCCEMALQQLFRCAPKKVVAEPMMELEVHLTDATYLGEVIRDLNDREPQTIDVLEDGISVRATVPMRRISRYVSHVRKAAKGNAYFFATLSHFKVVTNADIRKKILAEVR